MSQTIEYKDYTIVIEQDDHPMNPREEDANLGNMLCRHTRYNLGDDHMADREEVLDILEGRRKDVVAFPLYLYDHGNITMNTTGFSCPWDSGMVGCIFMTFDNIRKAYNVKRVTKKLIEKVKDSLRAEVREYDGYISGNVYGFWIQKDGEYTPRLLSKYADCWGFYGDEGLQHAIKEAKFSIDQIKDEEEVTA